MREQVSEVSDSEYKSESARESVCVCEREREKWRERVTDRVSEKRVRVRIVKVSV